MKEVRWKERKMGNTRLVQRALAVMRRVPGSVGMKVGLTRETAVGAAVAITAALAVKEVQ